MIIERPILDRAAWLDWRRAAINASEGAALFGRGIHPYLTAFQLWSVKSGLITDDVTDSKMLRRGRLLEPVVLDIIREDNPAWKVWPGGVYFFDEDAKIGATPDCKAVRPDVEGTGNIQVKTAGYWAFRKNWLSADGEVEVPLWIAVQASIEAALTGASWTAVAVVDEELQLTLIDVPMKPALMAKFRELASDFWRRVAEKDGYPPDWGRDAATIARIYAEDDGSTLDLGTDTYLHARLQERDELKAREADGAEAAKVRKEVDAELILRLGNAARGRMADGTLIEAKTVRRKAYEVAATTYRAVKVRR